MSEEPLHVRVAEALGWSSDGYPLDLAVDEHGDWWMNPPIDGIVVPQKVPRYDTDWSAAGPLVESLGITLSAPCAADKGEWRAWSTIDEVYWHEDYCHAGGRTPLEAVCNLILSLSAAGKLPK